MPEGAVYVGRPTKWGNPFTPKNTGRISPVLRFACEVAPLLNVSELRGRDLACWCRPDQECHADVLLEMANPEAFDFIGTVEAAMLRESTIIESEIERQETPLDFPPA